MSWLARWLPVPVSLPRCDAAERAYMRDEVRLHECVHGPLLLGVGDESAGSMHAPESSTSASDITDADALQGYSKAAVREDTHTTGRALPTAKGYT